MPSPRSTTSTSTMHSSAKVKSTSARQKKGKTEQSKGGDKRETKTQPGSAEQPTGTLKATKKNVSKKPRIHIPEVYRKSTVSFRNKTRDARSTSAKRQGNETGKEGSEKGKESPKTNEAAPTKKGSGTTWRRYGAGRGASLSHSAEQSKATVDIKQNLKGKTRDSGESELPFWERSKKEADCSPSRKEKDNKEADLSPSRKGKEKVSKPKPADSTASRDQPEPPSNTADSHVRTTTPRGRTTIRKKIIPVVKDKPKGDNTAADKESKGLAALGKPGATGSSLLKGRKAVADEKRVVSKTDQVHMGASGEDRSKTMEVVKKPDTSDPSIPAHGPGGEDRTPNMTCIRKKIKMVPSSALAQVPSQRPKDPSAVRQSFTRKVEVSFCTESKRRARFNHHLKNLVDYQCWLSQTITAMGNELQLMSSEMEKKIRQSCHGKAVNGTYVMEAKDNINILCESQFMFTESYLSEGDSYEISAPTLSSSSDPTRNAEYSNSGAKALRDPQYGDTHETRHGDLWDVDDNIEDTSYLDKSPTTYEMSETRYVAEADTNSSEGFENDSDEVGEDADSSEDLWEDSTSRVKDDIMPDCQTKCCGGSCLGVNLLNPNFGYILLFIAMAVQFCLQYWFK